jgi:hypothetical protein
MANVMKVSLHASGSWSWGFVAEDKAIPSLKSGESRHKDIWPAPPEFVPGWRRAYCIDIPGCELRQWDEQKTDDVTWVQLTPNDVAYVEVLIAEVGSTSVFRLDNCIDLAALALPSRGEARIVVRRVPWTEQDRHWAAGYRAMAIAQAPKAALKGTGGLRVALFAVLPDGARAVTELAST